jgi:AcrR family transcriptional regulator
MVKPLPPRPPRRAPRTDRLAAADRREAVLEAALPLFAVRGHAGTTTRELAKAAGVAEPILYRHFPSKADLFAAVLARCEARLLERMEATLAGATDAPERLRALADGLPSLLADLEDEFRVVNGAAATHDDARTAALVRRTYERLGSFLARALAASGLRRGVDAATAAHLLLDVGLGASLTRPLEPPAVRRRGFDEAVVRLLLSALTDDRRG